MSNERPILFSGPMIRAILDGRKTMTRRVATPRYDDRTPCEHWQGANAAGEATMFRHCCHGSEGRGCPHGLIGDRLWVRETWAPCTHKPNCGGVYFRADEDDNRGATIDKWRPSIFMPRWASRITLEITNVKVERVQDISEEDAKAEGVWQTDSLVQRYYCMAEGIGGVYRSAIPAFRDLWDSINDKRGKGWDVNPWVWALTLRRVK